MDLETAWKNVVALKDEIAYRKEELKDAEHQCGLLMTEKTAQLADGTLLHRSKTLSTTWDDDSLFEAVLDSRMVDPATGEVFEETPLHKVVAIYGSRPKGEKDADPRLPGRNASKTELRKRDIDPDAFCEKRFSEDWHVTEVRA